MPTLRIIWGFPHILPCLLNEPIAWWLASKGKWEGIATVTNGHKFRDLSLTHLFLQLTYAVWSCYVKSQKRPFYCIWTVALCLYALLYLKDDSSFLNVQLQARHLGVKHSVSTRVQQYSKTYSPVAHIAKGLYHDFLLGLILFSVLYISHLWHYQCGRIYWSEQHEDQGLCQHSLIGTIAEKFSTWQLS